MTDRHDTDDRMQALLTELRQAQQAGVFEPTPVSVEQLVNGGRTASQPSRARRVLVGLKAAACVGLVVGVASWWQLGRMDGQMGTMAGPNRQAVAVLTSCLAGPAASETVGSCGQVDYDTDGDVDLADYGAYQRSSLTGR